MTPSMEDYAALAREIGMELRPNRLLSEEYWFDRHPHKPIRSDLPAYLAKPAQMSRILRAVPLTVGPVLGCWWAYTHDMGELGYEESQAPTPEEAVRDAAALALRERA